MKIPLLRALYVALALFAFNGTLLRGQTSTLFADSFSTSGSLNGTTPTVTMNGAKWVALTGSGAPTSNGTAVTLPGQNQTDSLDLGSNYFANNPGVYTISLSVTLPSGTSALNLFGFGFLANPVTNANMASSNSNTGLNPAGGTNGGSPWVYIDQAGQLYVNSQNSTFIYDSASGAFPSGSTHLIQLMLDTTHAQWMMTAYVDGVQLDLNGGAAGMAYTFTTNPTNIRYVAMSASTSVISATVSNFSLTGPVPNPLNSTLISDTFPTSGSLNGTTPATTVAGAKWVALTGSGGATSNGTSLTVPGANQTDSIDLGPNYFANNPGVYSLSVQMQMPSGTAGTDFGFGFVVNPVTSGQLGSATSNTGLNPNGGTNSGTPWIYLTQSGELFVNNHDANYVYASGGYPSGTIHTLQLVLDTTQTQWVMNAFVDGIQLDLNGGGTGLAYTFTTNPTNIRYVAIAGCTCSTTATFTNFQLTGPTQNTLPPAYNPTLISDGFNTAGALNGTTPGTTVAGAKWVAASSATSSGSALTLPGSNQADTLDLGPEYFSSHPGVYTLSENITLPSGSGSGLFGLGFAVNPITSTCLTSTGTGTGLNPAGGTNGGTPWMAISQNGQVWVYNSGSNYIYDSGTLTFASGTTHTLQLVLNTTQQQWVLTAFVDSTQLDIGGGTNTTYTFATNPAAIRYVGVTSNTNSVTATVDNFALSVVPETAVLRVGDLTASGVVPGVRPYNDIWVTGQSYTAQSGGSVVAEAGSYGGSDWVVASSTAGASATYMINVPTTGDYLLEIAGSPIGANTSSPIAYSIDGGTPTAITGGSSSGASWSGGLVWNSAAVLNFTTTGSHTITISLTGPRASDGTYAFTIDALALVADPFNNVLYTDENFAQSQLWAATVSASSSNSGFPAANVVDGNPNVGWEPTVMSPTQSTLTITFPSARALDALRIVKGENAPSGSSMPTSYLIDTLENGTWVHRVNETANLVDDVTYELPGVVTATALRLTVVATQGTNYAFVNQLEAYGPFSPSIVAPANSSTVGNGTYNVCGYTQPNSNVALRINGVGGASVTSGASGWFSGDLSLVAGLNTIQADANLSDVESVRQSSTTTYSSGAAAATGLVTRKGYHAIANEGTNNVVVTGIGQSSSVPYTVTNEAGSTVSTGSLDLSQGAALLALPASTAGWYQIALSGSPTLTQSVSVTPSQFVLPSISRVAENIMTGGSIENELSASDQQNFVPTISDYMNTAQASWVRDDLSWASANPSNGTYAWTNYDNNINTWIAQGQKVLLNVDFFPPFYNSENNYQYVPDDLRKTYAWGQALGAHYLGRVSAYEFQNEFDWASTAKQTVNTLMAHQRAFYLGIRSVDPTVIIAPNPPAFTADAANELLNLRGEAMDVFPFHWYPTDSGTAAVKDLQGTNSGVGASYQMPANMALVTGNLENRAAWLTECGYYGNDEVDLTAADELAQADFYAKMAPLGLSYGLDNSFAFCFPYFYQSGSTQQFGMLRSSGFSPRAAVNSAAITAQQLRTAHYYGALNTGNPNITGLVFQNADGTYLLELWAISSGGTGAYALPGGVTDTGVFDYMGRITDTGTNTSVVVQTTAKFAALSGSGITSVTTPSTNQYPNPSESGVSPSYIVMAWQFTPVLPCKATAFEDYYDVAQSSVTTCDLEVVNLSTTTTFNGTIAATPSNSRWTLAPGASLTVSLPPNGRAVIPFTLTAPAMVDNIRIEARVDDANGQTSSAAEILDTLGTTPVVTPIQHDASNNYTLAAVSSYQNFFGYDGHLAWTPGTDGSVNYMGALPYTNVTFSNGQMFKAPTLSFPVSFTSTGNYYVWVKAKAGAASTNAINIGIGGFGGAGGVLQTNAAGISGFNTNSWTWSRTSSSGTATIPVTTTSTPTTIDVWPASSGIGVADVFFTTNSTYVPTF